VAQEPFSPENLPNWLRGRFDDAQRFLFLCIFAGVISGLVGVSFHLAVTGLFNSLWSLFGGLGMWGLPLMVLAPAVAGLFVGASVQMFAPNASGSGIPQTKVAFYQNFGVIKLSTAFWRFLVGTISVGFGNSLGREGPTVHICGALASKIGQWFGLGKLRVQAMVPVGMGAGISAAFNAPIAAITFVFEELLDDFSSKALGGILIAVVVAAVVERMLLGEHGALQANTEFFDTAPWMLICLLIGPAAALLGHVFVEALLRLRARFKQWRSLPQWVKPGFGGLGVGLIGVSVLMLSDGHVGVFSIGYDDLNGALNGRLVWEVLVLLLIGKMAATSLCYAAGASGGIFAPVLFMGSMLGGLFGVLLVEVFEVERSVLAGSALLGTGAFFAAVIRCPITSILIIFEMTRNYSLILPLMVGNLIAYAVAVKLRAVPVYDALIMQDGISLRKMPAYRGERDWRNLPVSTIMSYEITSVETDMDAAKNLKKIDDSGSAHHAYPVVDANEKLAGVVTHHELEEAKESGDTRPIREWVKKDGLVVVHPDQSIRDVANTLVTKDVLQAPVVGRKAPTRAVGIVTLHDIARQQNAIEHAMPRE